MPTSNDASESSKRRGAWRFLRKRRPAHLMAALCLIGSCVAAVMLCMAYNASRTSVAVYYFTTRPALVWFAMIAPGMVIGFFGVRKRWWLVFVAFWAACLFGSDDLRQLFKLFPGGGRERFETSRMAFAHFLNKGRLTGDVLEVPLRVVSWNVAAGRFDGEAVVAKLEELDADLILTQEFFWGSESHVKPPLMLSPGLRNRFHVFNRQAIISRYPVKSVSRRGYLPEWRCAVYQVDITPDAPLFVVNCHLSALVLKTQILRGWSAKALRSAIANSRKELDGLKKIVEYYMSRGPVLVTGDFNLPPNYPDLQFLKGTHQDCFAANGYGWGKTAPNRYGKKRIPPQMRVDMIWAPRGATVHYCATVRGDGSDHDLVLAEIAVPVPVTAADGTDSESKKNTAGIDAGTGQ